jgi:hypothetical protein
MNRVYLENPDLKYYINPSEDSVMKTNLVFAMFLLSVLGLAAQAAIVRTTDDAKYPGADTYVTNDNNSQGPNSNFGTEVRMRFRQNNTSRSKVAYIRFNITDVAGDLSGAFLTCETTYAKGSNKTVTVYGLTDESRDFWIESGAGGITYNTAPAMLTAAPGYYDLDESKVVSLGTFTTPPVPAAQPVRFSTNPANMNMTTFLGSDTNGAITVILVGSDDETEIATKEHATFIPPTLTIPNASTGGALNPQPQDKTSVNRSTLTQLSWTLIPGIAKCDVYFGADPNILDPDMDKITFAPAVESVNIADFPGFSTPLPAGKYYWRVDCYDKLTDPNVLIGPFWSFTATSAPVFSGISPAAQAKFEGQNADPITVVFESTSALTYAWYRSVDNDTSTGADDSPVGGNSDTLSLSGLTAADEGWYYCKATSAGGEAPSALARLTIKRLLAHWALDGNADDSSPAKLNGTLMGEPAFAAGVNEKTGQALTFDAVDDYVDMPDDFSDFTAGVTISVWANPAAVANWARFIDFGNGPDSDNIFLTRNTLTNNLTLNVYKGTASAGSVTATGALALNAWQMFVATMDDAGNVVLYKNGLPIQTGTIAAKPNIVTRTSNFIGDSNWTTDAFYNGLMDDIAIYNYAVSADTVADMYSAVAGNYCRISLALDYDGNCKVDLPDFAIFAADWLKCGLYPECP